MRLRNKETEEIKEQEIFMGDFPIMTNSGTFVINGAERVIVSQIVRSPGMYYARTADKADNLTFATTVIPYRGAWLEYETDLSDVFYVRIDKNRKLPITCLIRAVGPKTDAEIIEMFGEDRAHRSPPWRRTPARTMRRPCWRSTASCVPASLPRWTPPRACSTACSLIPAATTCPRWAAISSTRRWPCGSRLSGHTLAMPVADPRTGEIMAEAGEILTRERAQELDDRGRQRGCAGCGRQAGEGVRQQHGGYEELRGLRPRGVRHHREGVASPCCAQLLEQYAGEELKEAVADHVDDLIPKHITVDGHHGLHQLSQLPGPRRGHPR